MRLPLHLPLYLSASFACSLFLAACGGSVAAVSPAPDGGTVNDAAAGKDAASSVNHDAGNGTTADAGTTACDAKPPLKHRAAGALCPKGRGPGDATANEQPPGQCYADSDCTAGANGRCLLSHYGALTWQCSYDQCASDSDCPGSMPCDCRTSDADNSPNVCGQGSTCRTDSQCGACQYCSPTDAFDVICSSTPYRFVCHTAGDACLDDSDCAATNGRCNFDPSVGHWACVTACAVPPP